jgi:hypothetical protein
MCACKETDVRESANDSTLASGEGHGSCGEMCHPIYDKKKNRFLHDYTHCITRLLPNTSTLNM